MKEYLIIAGVTWLARTIIDIGVKHSKKTENTLDDIIFNNLKLVADMMKKPFKK